MLKMKFFSINITRLIGVLLLSIVVVYQRIFIIFQYWQWRLINITRLIGVLLLAIVAV